MYKVGDMVCIRDLPVGPGNDPLEPGLWYNSEMKKMAGRSDKIRTVFKSISGTYRYLLRLDNGNWVWTDAFLIPARQRTE